MIYGFYVSFLRIFVFIKENPEYGVKSLVQKMLHLIISTVRKAATLEYQISVPLLTLFINFIQTSYIFIIILLKNG